MSNDTVVSLAAPARVCDPLTELLRSGARRLIEAAVSAEFKAYLLSYTQEKLPDAWQRVVRNGYAPSVRVDDRHIAIVPGPRDRDNTGVNVFQLRVAYGEHRHRLGELGMQPASQFFIHLSAPLFLDLRVRRRGQPGPASTRLKPCDFFVLGVSAFMLQPG